MHRFLIILLVAVGALRAEVPASDAVSVEFSLYAWQTDLPRLRYSEAETIAPLTSHMRSALHAYVGPASLGFYSARADLRLKGVKRPSPLVSVTFPPGASRFTLLVQSDSRGRYRMQVLPENGDLLPPRFVQLHNFTEYLLFVSYDKDSAVQIPPYGAAYIHPAADVTVIEVSRAEGAKWRKLFNNVIELNSDKRGNVILAENGNGQITLHTLPAWPRKGGENTPEADSIPQNPSEE